MSSCARNPELCGAREFELRGPIALPPASGWKILTLPERAAHLYPEWIKHQGRPTSSKAAWAEYIDFLRSNGVKIGLAEVQEISIPQWCKDDPKRCRGYKAPANPNLPWAQEAWEQANREMANPEDPGAALKAIIDRLTALISGKDGCTICAKHWRRHRALNPMPENPSLNAAQHYLVLMHNLTREGKPPVAYEEVAAKFNWTTE